MSDSYWTVSYGTACRTGFSCRECKKVINKNEPIAVRDGRKMRFFYHRKCFSGSSDPRTQSQSTFNQGRLPGSSFQSKAPEHKGRGKWSVSSYGYNPSGDATIKAVKTSAQKLDKNDSMTKQITSSNSNLAGAKPNKKLSHVINSSNGPKLPNRCNKS